jgi:hypothetical protein
VTKRLAASISGAVKSVLIEMNYIDKDYRSTYYNFYAKKGQQYRPDCVRLHFFDGTVTFDANSLSLRCPDDRLTDHYFGYMVLRPTGLATIGRTVLSPDIRRGATGMTIAARHKVHLLGYKLEVHGFPSMDQHNDISVCAHAACWSILRHYSERYSIYGEVLIHDITVMAHEYNPGGLVPSRGLQMAHAERVFQEGGTFPIHIARGAKGKNDEAFYRQLCAYVESGFPLFAAMHGRRHAIAVIGYDWLTPQMTGVAGPSFAWDEVQSITVVDDNELPYLTVAARNSDDDTSTEEDDSDDDAPASGSTRKEYSAQDIDSFIVALPEKIFYPADAVEKLAPTLFKLGGAVGMPPADKTIIRYFITTGSALRSFSREHASEIDPQLLQLIMTLPFAQFVWVVEFATREQWASGRISVRAVIDATASLRETYPLWLMHGAHDALVFDRKSVGSGPKGMGTLALKDMGHAGYSRMISNLRPTQRK